ncbi:uncharacterized protein LOC115748042 isoform X2 [Rhodamnia argentea]|uniref:Uncharacterized protein LOC115748042 isoform X2 n=1 Tax=Rhodamnia argentea TaxID=178133 RepID=A0A8B8PZN3_9MYRT|nr:uncharacterized protein LOC115748042 isoform X2 [Rhodamnia argentea]
MAEKGKATSLSAGSARSKVDKSFKRALLPLLSTGSMEEIRKAFPSFSSNDQEHLQQLFIKVITSLHGHIEDVFQSLCDEMKVGTVLDTVEQLVEEQSLDLLKSDKTNVLDIARDLSISKQNEIQHLREVLEKAEEHNLRICARLELIKKGKQQSSVTQDALQKLLDQCKSSS